MENSIRVFLLSFNIFLKKIYFNTLFIDCQTAEYKGFKGVVNSLLTSVDNSGKNTIYFVFIIAKIFLLSKNIFAV